MDRQNRRLKEIVFRLEYLATHYPYPEARNFFGSYLKILSSGDQKAFSLLEEAISSHRHSSVHHICLIIFAVFRYVLIKEYNFYKVNDWSKVVYKFLYDNWIILISNLNRNFASFNPSRYFVLQYLLPQIFHSRKLNILDVGCGPNIGLLYLNNLNFFKKIIKINGVQNSFKFCKIKIHKMIGIDTQIPDVTWLEACAWQEKRVIYNRNLLKKLIKKGQRCFKQASIIQITDEYKSFFDCVFTCCVLYQVIPEERKLFIKNITRLLSKTGVWINVGIDPDIKQKYTIYKATIANRKNIEKPTQVISFIELNNGFIDAQINHNKIRQFLYGGRYINR